MMTFKHEIPLPYEFQFEAYDLNEQGKGMREHDKKITNDAISNLTWKLETLSKEN